MPPQHIKMSILYYFMNDLEISRVWYSKQCSEYFFVESKESNREMHDL